MAIRVGINGFGRMGRLAVRAAWGWPELEFVHVNEIQGGPAAAAHLLAFDSVHGRWNHECRAVERGFTVDNKLIGFSSSQTPGDVPWKEAGVEIVLEATGKFRTAAQLAVYFERGVKKVVVAAPIK